MTSHRGGLCPQAGDPVAFMVRRSLLRFARSQSGIGTVRCTLHHTGYQTVVRVPAKGAVSKKEPLGAELFPGGHAFGKLRRRAHRFRPTKGKWRAERIRVRWPCGIGFSMGWFRHEDSLLRDPPRGALSVDMPRGIVNLAVGIHSKYYGNRFHSWAPPPPGAASQTLLFAHGLSDGAQPIRSPTKAESLPDIVRRSSRKRATWVLTTPSFTSAPSTSPTAAPNRTVRTAPAGLPGWCPRAASASWATKSACNAGSTASAAGPSSSSGRSRWCRPNRRPSTKPSGPSDNRGPLWCPDRTRNRREISLESGREASDVLGSVFSCPGLPKWLAVDSPVIDFRPLSARDACASNPR